MVLVKPTLRVIIVPPVTTNLPTAPTEWRSGAVDVLKKHSMVGLLLLRVRLATLRTRFVVVTMVISMYVS